MILLLLTKYRMWFHESILRSFVPCHFIHSCQIIFGNGFLEFIWKFLNYNMLCKLFIIMKLAFPPPPLIILITRLCLIPLFYKFFKVGNYHFEIAFWRLKEVRLTIDGGWTFVIEVLDDVHYSVDLTHSFVYNSRYDFISIDWTSWWYVIC